MQCTFDIIIVGGGAVGLALAAALKKSTLNVALVEPIPPITQCSPTTQSVVALNIASQRLLAYVQCWPISLASTGSSFNKIIVWDQSRHVEMKFCADQHGFEQLGYIVNKAQLNAELWRVVNNAQNITLFTQCSVKQAIWHSDYVSLRLSNGNTINAKLVVGADGINSKVAQQAGIAQYFYRYQHSALVTTVNSLLSHQETAYQIFTHDSILAFLPLADRNRYSIVWSLPSLTAQKLCATDIKTFNQSLSVASDMRLGLCEAISDRQIFPLSARLVKSFIGHRIALIGDAAHTMHPLAGQGVNLGFMDVAELITILHKQQHHGADIGLAENLHDYHEARFQTAARLLMEIAVIQKSFTGNHFFKSLSRGLVCNHINKNSWLQRKVLLQALGLFDMPEWLKE